MSLDIELLDVGLLASVPSSIPEGSGLPPGIDEPRSSLLLAFVRGKVWKVLPGKSTEFSPYEDLLEANPLIYSRSEGFVYLRVNGVWARGDANLDDETITALALVQIEKRSRKIQDAKDFLHQNSSKPSRSRTAIPDEIKVSVFRRDGGCCVVCGSTEDIEYDHVIPFSRGGSNSLRNIQILCRLCNRKKGDSLTVISVEDSSMIAKPRLQPKRRGTFQSRITSQPAIYLSSPNIGDFDFEDESQLLDGIENKWESMRHARGETNAIEAELIELISHKNLKSDQISEALDDLDAVGVELYTLVNRREELWLQAMSGADMLDHSFMFTDARSGALTEFHRLRIHDLEKLIDELEERRRVLIDHVLTISRLGAKGKNLNSEVPNTQASLIVISQLGSKGKILNQ